MSEQALEPLAITQALRDVTAAMERLNVALNDVLMPALVNLWGALDRAEQR